MKGTYKVYNSNKGEWVNLDHTAAYDNVRVKITDDHKLYVSYNYGADNSWEYVGDVGGNIDISGKADKATTLKGYGITDAYTKTETENKLNNKANAAYLESLIKHADEGDIIIETNGRNHPDGNSSQNNVIQCAYDSINLISEDENSTGTLSITPNELSFGNFKIMQKEYKYTIYFPGNDNFGGFVGELTNDMFETDTMSYYIFEGQLYFDEQNNPIEEGRYAKIYVPIHAEFWDYDVYDYSLDEPIVIEDEYNTYYNMDVYECCSEEKVYPTITRSVPYSLRPAGSVAYINNDRILTSKDLPEHIVTETGNKRLILEDESINPHYNRVDKWKFQVSDKKIEFVCTENDNYTAKFCFSEEGFLFNCNNHEFEYNVTEDVFTIDGAEIITTDNLMEKIQELS